MQRGIFWRIISLLWVCALGGAVHAADAPSPSPDAFTGKAGTYVDIKLPLDGESRDYRLVVPDTVDLSKPAPIVFAFHGMGEDNKDHYAQISGLPELATAHKFILVFPAAGTQTIQNQSVKAWAMTPGRAAADVKFFDAMLAKLRSQYRIDPDAVYLTGMSNGAYFAHLLGRERADTIAAVAAHSGELGELDLGLLATARKFPVMIIHGDADPIFNVSNAERARLLYKGAGHPVTYLIIPGWGHQWDKRVDEKIWDFFSASRLHPLVSTVNNIPAAPTPKPAPATLPATR